MESGAATINDPSHEDGGIMPLVVLVAVVVELPSGSTEHPRYVCEGNCLIHARKERCASGCGMMYGWWKRNKEHGHGVLRSDRIIYKGRERCTVTEPTITRPQR
jgi:hypothetical protein